MNESDFEILASDAGRLVSLFQTVFDHDWYHTKTCMVSPLFIPENGTFLRPGLDNEEPNNQEDSDWCNRACILDAYRSLSETLRRLQRHPDQLEDPSV